MNHVMIDLETMACTPDALFISIGAVIFDPYTGKQGDTFYARIDWDSGIERGRKLDTNTIRWWLKQSDAARYEITKRGKPLDKVLEDFWKWLPESCIVWGNGATFDISILEHAYNYNPPWNFWNVRDVRTVVEMASGIMKRPDLTEGVAHNALEDAKHQAKYVSDMFIKMREGK